MTRAIICVEDGAFPIFDRHLSQGGYTFEDLGILEANVRGLAVVTTNTEALGVVLSKALCEANQIRGTLQ